MQQFKSKFRSIDLLIIDDVQFLIGKERTQEEFFHTFNELHQRGKQIVLTSDKVPQELTGLEERLRTRFSSGLSADLQTPDFETRVAILNKKAERLDIAIPNDVAGFLAEKVDTNIRELEGALNRIQAMSSLSESDITLELAQTALSSLHPSKKREITTEIIQQAVASKFNVSIGDLLGKRRTQNIALARHVAMYLCRKLTGRSYPEIGAVFGGRDHSTAIHACKKLEDCLDQDSKLKSQVSSIESHLIS
jgi:chromosomal replication initiator protein